MFDTTDLEMTIDSSLCDTQHPVQSSLCGFITVLFGLLLF